MANYKNRINREDLLQALREVRNYAEMDGANFYPFDPEGDNKMHEIRTVSRIWRESWIIGPLEALISRLEAKP